jgi:hypothetical protein
MPKAVYKNGNALVKIDLENGTKERMTKADEFNLSFPETIDLNIGTRCDGHCPYCYINASENGVDADLSNVPFIGSLHPYTEVAINGNSVDHPQLIQFLEELKKRRIIANITVNQIHFERKIGVIKDLADRGLVKGIGISLRRPTPGFIRLVQEFPNAVIHTIVGILTPEDISMLMDKDLKILILGYKDLGRGVDYKTNNLNDWKTNKDCLYEVLPELIDKCNVVSFDNLAINQLNVRRLLTDEQWEEFYMGDEGTASMYIDLVTQKFGVSSLCSEDEMFSMTNDVKEMFNKIKIKQLTNI